MNRRDMLKAALLGTVAAALSPWRALGGKETWTTERDMGAKNGWNPRGRWWTSSLDQTSRLHRVHGHRADMIIIDDPPGTDQPGHWTYTLDGGSVYDSRLGRFRCIVMPLLGSTK